VSRGAHDGDGADGSIAGLADEPVILSMGADPEPDEPIGGLDRNRSVMQANARRPETADLL
jgi:hypothetical protein